MIAICGLMQGTQESFLMASNYVKSVEDKTGMKDFMP